MITNKKLISFKNENHFAYKHQQGGAVLQQNIQQQVKQLVQAAAQGNKEASALIQQIVDAAKQGDQQAILILELILQEIQALQMARKGAKLNYLKSLKGDCPEGEELVYFQKGGSICKKCEKKKQETLKKTNDSVVELKKGKRLKKCQNGDKVRIREMVPIITMNEKYSDLGRGYGTTRQKITSELKHYMDENGQWHELSPAESEPMRVIIGRDIYKTPYGNDTIYFDNHEYDFMRRYNAPLHKIGKFDDKVQQMHKKQTFYDYLDRVNNFNVTSMDKNRY